MDGKIRLGYAHMVRLHEDVIDNLCKMAGIRWQSCARWPDGTTTQKDYETRDEHDTRSGAEGVCRLLREQGFGGDGKWFPIKAWVEAV